MKGLLALIAFTILIPFFGTSEANAALKNETLHYTITYKWGLIHKDAAKATLKLTNVGNQYRMLLTARTLPWADRIFEVRDTLRSTAIRDGFTVTGYEKTTHEGGRYARDIIKFLKSGNHVSATTTCVREGKDGKISRESKSLSGTAPAFDMLSVFYYIRLLDFNHMTANKPYKFTIFSGKKSETLSIKKVGVENIRMRNKNQRSAYKLSFSFTSGGKKKSSDNILAYISADGQKIPLYLVGKLPIGEVRVYLNV